MGNKRKRRQAPSQDVFTFSAAEVAQSSRRDTRVIMQHADDTKTTQKAAVLTIPQPEPEPAEPMRLLRDFEDIRGLLGDTDDVQNLQDSDEVIHHYIQAPGRQQRRRAVPNVSMIDTECVFTC